MLPIEYIDTVMSIELPNKYPCENLATGTVRIYDCLDVDKRYFEFFSLTTNGKTDRIRVLVPGCVICQTVQDMIDYSYKSVNRVYYVKNLGILYKYLGSEEGDILTFNNTIASNQNPIVYRNGDITDVVFTYFTSIDDLTNKLGDFRQMVPVFLNNRNIDQETGEIDEEYTVAPFTLAQYVFLQTGETVEEKCNQITRFHRLSTSIIASTDTSKIYIVCPFDNYFEYNTGTAQVNFVDVSIGSVIVTPDRYTIKYDSEVQPDGKIKKNYYIEFNKDANGNYEFVVEAGRTVYVTYYYNAAVNSASQRLSMIDGTDIIRQTIPTDRLQKVTDDTNTVDNDVLVSAYAMKKLRDEMSDLVSRYVGGNVIHCNATTAGSIVTTDVDVSSRVFLNLVTGATIYLTLDRDLPNAAMVNMAGIYTGADRTTLWSSLGNIPIYLPHTNDQYHLETAGPDELVPRYTFTAGQTLQLVYNDIMGSPRFYVNTGEHYRLVETWAKFDYEPDISSDTTTGVSRDIYISNTSMEWHFSPCIEYLPNIDSIEVYRDGQLLLDGYGYQLMHGTGAKNSYIRITDLPVDNITTIMIKVTALRNLY